MCEATMASTIETIAGTIGGLNVTKNEPQWLEPSVLKKTADSRWLVRTNYG